MITAVKNRVLRDFVLSLSLFFIVYLARNLEGVSNPYMKAEEVSFYLATAFKYDWQVIFMPLISYYCLFNNLVAFLQTRFPLEYAPAISSFCTVVIQAIPVCLVVLEQSRAEQSRAEQSRAEQSRSLGYVFSFIYAFLIAPDSFLNTTHLHFFFFVISLFILSSDSHHYKIIKNILLALSMLSSAMAVWLTPLFFLKEVWELKRERSEGKDKNKKINLFSRYSYSLISVMSLCIQTASFFVLRQNRYNAPLELHKLSLGYLYNFLTPIFSHHDIMQVFEKTTPFLLYGLGLFVAFSFFYLVIKNSFFIRHNAIIMALALVGYQITAYVCGLPCETRGCLALGVSRYWIPPLSIAAFVLATWIIRSIKQKRYMLTFMLLGYVSFSTRTYIVKSVLGGAYPVAKWEEELLLWKKSPQHHVNIFPNGYRAALPCPSSAYVLKINKLTCKLF